MITVNFYTSRHGVPVVARGEVNDPADAQINVALHWGTHQVVGIRGLEVGLIGGAEVIDTNYHRVGVAGTGLRVDIGAVRHVVLVVAPVGGGMLYLAVRGIQYVRVVRLVSPDVAL